MSEFNEWELTLHILKVLGIVGIIIVLLFVVLYFILKSFIISYVTEKGKNLATKEDIAEITKKTEEIKTLYAKQLEETLQQNRVILEQYKTKILRTRIYCILLEHFVSARRLYLI